MDIEVREGTGTEYFEVVEKLYRSTLKRKAFKGVDPLVFAKAQQLLSARERMKVVVAFWEGQHVTAHATSHLGNTALGILAASNEKGLECGAPYLAWWKTLLAAKSAGMKRYDLGGIDPYNNPSVYQFKVRMGAEEALHIGAFEAYSSLRVKLIWRIAEKVYNLIKK